MDGDGSLKLTDKEIASAFADPLYAQRFPPVLSIEQAAALPPDPCSDRLPVAVPRPTGHLLP